MMRNIAIGFVTFNADESLLLRLSMISRQGFISYIFDNSPQKSIIRDYCKDNPFCRYITAGKNVGLGFGISTVCAQAYYDAFKGLIFFDQDTGFDTTTLDFIENFYIDHKLLAANYSSIVFNAKNYQNKNDFDFFRDVSLSINSGSLYFLENVQKLNWFNETYFVDCVDYEFCLNSNNNNFKIGEYSATPGFDHVTEQADSSYMILGKEYRMRKYPYKRFWGTVYASLRLFFTALWTKNIKFSVVIMRSLAIYLYFQSLIRIITVFKTKK